MCRVTFHFLPVNSPYPICCITSSGVPNISLMDRLVAGLLRNKANNRPKPLSAHF